MSAETHPMICMYLCIHIYVCVEVCQREREREKDARQVWGGDVVCVGGSNDWRAGSGGSREEAHRKESQSVDALILAHGHGCPCVYVPIVACVWGVYVCVCTHMLFCFPRVHDWYGSGCSCEGVRLLTWWLGMYVVV